MTDMLDAGRRVLAAQPFSALLGAELTGFSDGTVEFTIPVRPELTQHHGFVHGGAIASLADNALTFAGGTVLGPAVVTSEFKINFLRPAMGEFLVARAVVVHHGKRQAVCRCDIFVSHRAGLTLCAVGQGTITKLSKPPDSEVRRSRAVPPAID